jgi:thioester reductase-like protein
MKVKIITNNPLVYSLYSEDYDIDYKKISYQDILKRTRDYVHKGHELLTHPLSGSVKPNETPFKTLLISSESKDLNLESLSIIENSIETTEKFLQRQKKYSDDIEKDFMEIDLSLIENVINKLL